MNDLGSVIAHQTLFYQRVAVATPFIRSPIPQLVFYAQCQTFIEKKERLAVFCERRSRNIAPSILGTLDALWVMQTSGTECPQSCLDKQSWRADEKIKPTAWQSGEGSKYRNANSSSCTNRLGSGGIRPVANMHMCTFHAGVDQLAAGCLHVH